jgi:hypothetical protein
MKELVFKVSLEETNLILEGLGHLPFARVYALVEKVQQQASEQLKGGSELVVVPAAGSPATQSGGSVNGGSNGQ